MATLEIWKPVRGYEGHYEVSDQGRVKSVARVVMYSRWGRENPRLLKERVLRPKMNREERYLYVVLQKRGVPMTIPIAPLVAQHFIPNPENKPTVKHINGIQTDNRAENLEWMS